jgi:DNA-binding CsgD family transcriptional regulator
MSRWGWSVPSNPSPDRTECPARRVMKWETVTVTNSLKKCVKKCDTSRGSLIPCVQLFRANNKLGKIACAPRDAVWEMRRELLRKIWKKFWTHYLAFIISLRWKNRAELSRREEEIIRRYATREIDRYRNAETSPFRQRPQEGEAASQEVPGALDAWPAQDAAAAARATEKTHLTDAERILIIKTKEQGLNSMQIDPELPISPSTIRSFLSRAESRHTLHGTNGRPKKAPPPADLARAITASVI